MSERVYNFSAGPATLPLPVLEKAREQMLCYPGAGANIMEISHRSKTFQAVLDKAKSDLSALLNLPEGYHILFLAGGATLQFSMLAMNFLNGKTADYINTGAWATKAMKEAGKHGTARAAWSGKAEKFVRVPADFELALDENAEYVHYTANETIEGIEFFAEPDAGGKPLFCDASSDFLSHPIAIEKYALLYAGAQKNLGPSGVAVAILRDDMVARVPAGLPSLLDYRIQVENDSLYNTPATYTIYLIGLVLDWLRNTVGGVEKIYAINRAKADSVYKVIDDSAGYYRGHAMPECRSIMNVSFRLPSEDLEAKFISEATKAGLHGLKGHRSVGGCRASIYNAMPIEGVEALNAFMREFQKNNG